uniref:Contactin n=1 Tax=Timema monikensis TaxID=170555 RepID=A0A7R9HJP7_9NEOP|nr:unnamed protein product [Timema monikensis]
MTLVDGFCGALLLTLLAVQVTAQIPQDQDQWRCPQYWVQFQASCYRFIKSPLRNRNEARRNCQLIVESSTELIGGRCVSVQLFPQSLSHQAMLPKSGIKQFVDENTPYAYESDLVSVDSPDEYGFMINQLQWQDPQHRRWYTSAHQQSPDYWINEGDGTSLVNMENAFLPEQDPTFNKDYLAYSFSNKLNRWGFEKVKGDELLLFICEVPVATLRYMVVDDRTYQYGVDIDNPEKIPRGPYFIKQPHDVVFDLSKNTTTNDVSLSCLAGGYPTPTYNWFKEDYENDRLVAKQIDPLSDRRYTLSGGTLIIFSPKQIEDRGTYHCKASNKFGTIVSESVQLSFGYIGEFNLKRSPENGNQNWGKTVYCDPPQHFPAVKYYWARDYFPNFVEEDKRVFVSFDGALYFSALEHIDKGNYSCTVQSKVSDQGRNGPFFTLNVNPHSNYQQLKFPNNFPKAFPEAPVAGEEVRLDPPPSYNWTRRDGNLPRGAVLSKYNRVLVLPQVQVEDQGEYVCRAANDRSAIVNSVVLSIQAEPNFTIPLVDRHMDNKADLTWTCEAFGIPDVNYSWLRNGELIEVDRLPDQDRDRYHIVDNPSFKKHPLEGEIYAAEGGNITILCNPEAAPKPKFLWKKDGNVIGSGGRRRILENGNLIISPVSRDDEGVYSCNAQNMHGFDESHGRLVVLQGPRFIQQMIPRIVTSVQQNVELRCQAMSEELLDVAYIWTHNGLRIKDSDLFHTRVNIDGGILDIQNTTFAEAGDYECIIKSAVGRIATRTSVIVQGPPGPPGAVQVDDVGRTSASIQWTDGASNGRPIYMYTVSGRTNWNSTWANITETMELELNRYSGRKKANLENSLSPWSTYEFRVSACNQLGCGQPSAPSPQFNTLTDRPYKAPSKIGGGGGKIGDLTITWEPLKPQDQNAPGIYYKIFWRRTEKDTEFQTLALKEYGNVNKFVVRIQQEWFFTQYDVKVQAVNDIGYGPESEIFTIYSAEDMPQVAPTQVSARSFNSTALNVSWLPIEQTREKIHGRLIGHRLKYWKKDNAEETAVYYLSRSTQPWALVVGLQPDTYYYVKAMAYNSAGEGPESERFLERTFRKAPQKPPSSVHIFLVDPSTVRVVWRYVAPSLEEEPLIGYKVRVWSYDQDMSTANDTIVYVGSKLEAYITNLSFGKAYNMRLLAFSNGGDGRMSSPAVTFKMGEF